MARSFEAMGQHSRAERSLRRALEIQPDDKEARLLLGRALIGLDRPAEAAAEYERVLERDPRDLRAHLGKGVALDLQGRHEQAQDVYRAGLDVDPSHLSLLNNLALSRAFSGDLGEATGILRELVADPAAPARVRRNLALVYVLSGRREAAAATLAVDLSPREVEEEILYYELLRSGGGDVLRDRWPLDRMGGGTRGQPEGG